MTVATFKQPDFTMQDASAYKVALDGGFSVLARSGQVFAPHAAATPNMTVVVDAGFVFDGLTTTNQAQQVVGPVLAPVASPRVDLVVCDIYSGIATVVSGVEASSPVVPAVPSGKFPVAQISLTAGVSAITNSMITDVRAIALPPSRISGGDTISSGYSTKQSDLGNALKLKGNFTVSLVSTIGAGWWVQVKNVGNGTVTLIPQSGQIDGSTSLALAAGQGGTILFDGANFFSFGLRGAGGGLSAAWVNALSSSTTLTAAAFGVSVVFSGSTESQTLTCPLLSAGTVGQRIEFVNQATVAVTVAMQGSDTCQVGTSSGVASFTLKSGETLTIEAGSSSWLAVAGSLFSAYKGMSQQFTSSGTWTCPPGVTTVYLTMVGGGGGGAGYSSGNWGGGSGYVCIRNPVSVVPGTVYQVTIGYGGAGAGYTNSTAGNTGSPGGVTSFGALASISGGAGGYTLATGGSIGAANQRVPGGGFALDRLGGQTPVFSQYGRGGDGSPGNSPGSAGGPGFLMVEW